MKLTRDELISIVSDVTTLLGQVLAQHVELQESLVGGGAGVERQKMKLNALKARLAGEKLKLDKLNDAAKRKKELEKASKRSADRSLANEGKQSRVALYNNRRGIVSTFLKFAQQRDWITDNPLTKIPPRRIRRRRGGAVTFNAQQAKELMAFVEVHYTSAVPFFALCLFAGIRPCLRTGEILRLPAEHVKLDTSMICIDAKVSKVREPRNVTIQPNLAAWLRAYPLAKFPIIPANLQHIREKVAEKFPLSHDVMRHTFISMFVAKFRSLGEAALQAGNSEGIIRRHYLDLKSSEEAEQFFGIMPSLVAAVPEKTCDNALSLVHFAA